MKIKDKNGFLIYSRDDMEKDTYVIEMIEAFEKRKGTGTKLINQMKKIANNKGKKISLCAYPQDESISLENLISFYENLDFNIVYDDGSAAIMEY